MFIVYLLLHPLHVSVLVVVHELEHVIQISRRQGRHAKYKDRREGQTVRDLEMVMVWKQNMLNHLLALAVGDIRSGRCNCFTFLSGVLARSSYESELSLNLPPGNPAWNNSRSTMARSSQDT